MILRNYPYLRVALLVIPALSILTTTPVLMVLDNDVRVIPVVWTMACIPLTISWFLNFYLFQKFKENICYQWVTSFIIMVVLTTLVRSVIDSPLFDFINTLEGKPLRRIPPLITTIIVVVMNNTLIIIFQTLVRYRLKQVQFVKQLSEAQVLRVKAQFENLKNQIHPHFLFNALNTLKILIRKDPDKAEDYVIRVSSFLRSSIQSGGQSFYSIEEDFNIGLNYLSIQEVRFKGCFILNTEIRPEHLVAQVPVLTIQCLLENALKHNVLSKDAPLEINVRSIEGDWMEVSNQLRGNHSLVSDSMGTGLYNLSERFEILGLPKIIVTNDLNRFSVQFKLHLI